MNLYLRLLLALLKGFRTKQKHPLEPIVSYFRVMPWDLDVLGHMNNGRYLQISDVARMDWMSQARILNAILRNRWGALLGGSLIRYSRALKLWQKYRVVTRVTSWDERWFFIEHRFETMCGKEVACCLTRAALRSKKGWAGTQPIIDEVVPGLQSPAHCPKVSAWLNADDTLVGQQSFSHVAERHSQAAAFDYLTGNQPR
ncbi:hypothetical protein GCM10009092_09970 [Bowmanella denitrificans]|uniref:Thioesterase n=1 Tax=Bowmanella denitrificans TaxID=366582 RepID=A0ABP3GK33_9ALTE|nr:thioesterase family protein [Bowmanella denitrificans]